MALDALRIHGNASYSWYGVQHRVLPNRVRSLLDEQDLRSCLLSAVEARLDEDFYSIGGLDSEVERLHFTESRRQPPRALYGACLTPIAVLATSIGVGASLPGTATRSPSRRTAWNLWPTRGTVNRTPRLSRA